MILAHDIAGDGPLVVLIHGITEDRRAWDPVDLTERFTVLRVDLRGHGRSRVVDPYDPATLAGDVHDTVESVRAGEVPLVVGHSMGGIVATAYGVLFPSRGVVNVDQPLALGAMQTQVKAIERMLRSPFFPLVMRTGMRQMSGTLPAAELKRLARIRRPRKAAVLGMWAPLLEQTPEQLERTVGELTGLRGDVPYLVVSGYDQGPEYLAWLTTAIPTTVHEAWGPPTHYPHLREPERFAARVAAFSDTGR